MGCIEAHHGPHLTLWLGFGHLCFRGETNHSPECHLGTVPESAPGCRHPGLRVSMVPPAIGALDASPGTMYLAGTLMRFTGPYSSLTYELLQGDP